MAEEDNKDMRGLAGIQYLQPSPELRYQLLNLGLTRKDINSKEPIPGEMPYTQYGARKLAGETVVPNLAALGATIPDPRKTGESFIAYSQEDKNPSLTRAHEIEHALSYQNLLPRGENINSMWDKLIKENNESPTPRSAIVERLVQHAPYLVKEWGLPDIHQKTGYFSGRTEGRGGFLEEQLATISALEQAAKRSFTHDPYVQKHILKTPAERETYNALVGLRQSRLDPIDLEPYTRVAEPKEPSITDRIKKMVGLSKGGSIVKPITGGSKTI